MSNVLGVLILCQLIANHAVGQITDAKPNVGDQLFIELTDKLAQEYSSRLGVRLPPDPGLTVQSSATVEQQLKDGQLRISHHSPVKSAGKPRMLTLTAVVDPKQITVDLTPANTQVYASPALHQSGAAPAPLESDSAVFRLKLSDLKGVKLQVWEAIDEIGN